MRAGEELFVFLDDVYILSSPARTRFLYNLVGERLLSMSGIQIHTGRTRCWNRIGQPPPDVEALGPAQEGSRFSERRWDQRNSIRRRAISGCRKNAGCGRLFSGYPICSVLGKSSLRTMPPGSSASCAEGHDEGMSRAMHRGELSRNRKTAPGREDVATLHMRLGGLGLRSAQRLAHAACWASWADALPMISDRLPVVATSIVTALENQDARGCLGELSEAAHRLDREGFVSGPDWRALSGGARPPVVSKRRAWRVATRLAVPGVFLFRTPLSGDPWCCQLHVPPTKRICGPGSSNFLLGAPTKPSVPSWLRLPLNVVEARCEYGIALDAFGRQRAECLRSGRLRTRAVPPERTLARICREAGATVRCNAKLRDMNVVVSASDERSIEVFGSNLPFHRGTQLAIDVTLRSALPNCGNTIPGAARENGAALARARPDKERKYAELLEGDRCHVVVVALETGGRWSSRALEFVESLGDSAREAPSILRRSVHLAWARRWGRMLSRLICRGLTCRCPICWTCPADKLNGWCCPRQRVDF